MSEARFFFENESREKIGHKVEDIISDLSRTSQDLFFFELGAHHGYYTLLASKLINNGRCIAVEPSPMNVSRIEENINLNGYNNIEIENVAVGSKKEDKRLAILETSQRHRFLKDCHQDEPKRTVPVTVLPFDNIASKYNIPKDSPVILRIDTEYHEKEVLNGMGRFLSTTRPIYIIMEVHNTEAYSGYPAVKTLYEHGFSLQYIDEKIAGNNKNLLKDMQNREENVEILAIRRPEDDGS